MAFVYIAPLSDRTAFKVGKAVAPSARLSQLMRFHDFEVKRIVIVDCRTVGNAFALESLLHNACEGMRVILPHDGGTEFFSHKVFDEALSIARSVCRINDYETVAFVRERTAGAIEEDGLIVEVFAAKIRARRLELDLSQEAVAKLAKVSKRTIERIENRGQSTFRNMVAVLIALNLEHLLAGLEVDVSLRQRSTRSSRQS